MNRSLVQLFPFHRRFSRILLSSTVDASVDRAGLPFEIGATMCCDPFRRYTSSRVEPRSLWEGSSYETLLRKFESALPDDSLEEAWEAFGNFKMLHGFPEQRLIIPRSSQNPNASSCLHRPPDSVGARQSSITRYIKRVVLAPREDTNWILSRVGYLD
ncbi:hypothetical protein OPV22_005451 [Ensete ventricosum]|uniref:Uncharacterized protein n=1 Tax=Ensete ventricosum TaxID=4639 RepID=A0AAV8RCU3_ENSVE|nr:hypothetical protein OPV22_005451 [Ensete ventricosum]